MDLGIFAFGSTGWGDELAVGFVITLSLALLSYAIGTVLGLALSLLELRRSRAIAGLASGYGVLFRSVPELLVLFLVFYGASFMISGLFGLIGLDVRVSLNAFSAGVVALSLVHAAYSAEVFKGAFRAVPTGMREAAQALGLRPRVAFMRVVLPVALRYAFPGLANLWMVMIKNTPLVSAIGVADLIGQASAAGANTKAYFAFFTAALAIYLVVSALSMAGQAAGERRLFRHLPASGG